MNTRTDRHGAQGQPACDTPAFTRRQFLPLLATPVAAVLAGLRPGASVHAAETASAQPLRWGMNKDLASAWARIEEAANKEGEVTYYGQGLLSQSQIPLLQKAFNADYPAIKINMLNAGSGQRVVSRITTEQESRQYHGDLFDTSVRQGLHSMDPLGFTQSFLPPAGQDKSVQWRDPASPNPGKSGVTLFRSQIHCFFVNSNLVKPEDEPRTYLDFTHPKHRGGIVWNPPWSVGSGWLVYHYAKKTYGEEWIKKMQTQQPTFIPNNAEAMGMLARGEHRLALGVNSSTATTNLIRAGMPIKAIWPTDFTIKVPGAVVFLKGAPHPNATKVLINWFLTANGQRFWASVGQWPLRTDIPSTEAWMRGGPASSVIHDQTLLTEEIQKATNDEAAKIFRKA